MTRTKRPRRPTRWRPPARATPVVWRVASGLAVVTFVASVVFRVMRGAGGFGSRLVDGLSSGTVFVIFGAATAFVLYVLWMAVRGLVGLPWGIRRGIERGLRRRRVEGGLCPVCGYDLRASPRRCPECGTAVRRGG